MAYPNGLAVSPDGTELVVVESTLPPTNAVFVPETTRLVVANIGDRYLSVFDYSG